MKICGEEIKFAVRDLSVHGGASNVICSDVENSTFHPSTLLYTTLFTEIRVIRSGAGHEGLKYRSSDAGICFGIEHTTYCPKGGLIMLSMGSDGG